MEFMSEEHVAAMNALLEDAPQVREACAQLDRPRTMSYRLADGPAGRDVHWAVTFTDTVRFSLDEKAEPDVLLVGSWTQMIRASRANRHGEQIDPGVSIEGDAAVLAEVGPVLEASRAAATLPVQFPDV
jgi:hypothetical protein